MTPGLVFTIVNVAVVPVWLLLAFAPRWPWTQRFATVVIPVVFAIVYLVALVHVPPTPGGSFTSLDGVLRFFTRPEAVLAGWIHYLIFDLFIGSWQTRDAAHHGIKHVFVIPCLLLTFLAGPLGLALYLVVRMTMSGRLVKNAAG